MKKLLAVAVVLMGAAVAMAQVQPAPRRSLSTSASVDFATLAGAGVTCADVTITLAGAATGDSVALGLPNALGGSAGIVYYAWVSAANTVSVRACDVTAVGTDLAAATVKVTVVR